VALKAWRRVNRAPPQRQARSRRICGTRARTAIYKRPTV